MSFTIRGLIVAIIGLVLQQSGATIGSENISNFVEVFIQIAGIGMAYWGRFRQGDITPLGRKI